MKRTTYTKFEELYSACLRIYPRMDVLDSIPRDSKEYEFILFDDRKSILQFAKEESLRDRHYIILAGKLTPYSSDQPPCVLFLGEIGDSLDKITIGGCY